MSGAVFETSLGRVAGVAAGGVVHVPRLRYALPPTGARRFALPEPVTAREDISGARTPGPVPLQLPSRLAKVMGSYPAAPDEDCLHLDIWVPEGASGAPVFVFLHGGAYMTGGGSLPCYEGAALAARTGMVVVNVSYRLGVMGFLPLPGLAPANLGLHDQVAALRFIRREIGAFGGNAANITLAGQSAGGFSIAALLSMGEAAARPLFDRAVLLSAPMGMSLQGPEAREAPAAAFLDALGLAPGDRAGLEAVSAEALMAAQGAVLRARSAAADDVTPPFMPVIDGTLITRDPVAALLGGAAAWCPVIAGTTREEHAAFYYGDAAVAAAAPELLARRLEEAWPGDAGALARLRARRPGADALALLIDVTSELRFQRGTRAFLEAQVAAGGAAWAYSFDWQSPDPGIAACHCIELPFLFANTDTWAEAPMLRGAERAGLDGLATAFGDALAGFARTGTPQDGTPLAWPGYGPGGAVMHFDRFTSCSAAA
ncbi:carboxylesterase/lipase family protein [Oceanicella sp. SM1341]|uniref:carboxylesterase/lipase family protein n=1 Tax=Oceanicella sp. SM1341 TaxID=1548889 RepID=UPI000E4DF79A|nr:carboxylesterase family protein [Oceanicella sp. SM1341]